MHRSQSDLQANNRQFSKAISSLLEYVEHPSQRQSCEATVNLLREEVDTSHEEQQQLLDKAVQLTNKLYNLYGERPLGHTARECMDMYDLFMSIITPFFIHLKFPQIVTL